MVLFDLSLCQTSSPFLVSRFETVQIRCNSIRFFSKVSIEDSYGRLDINSSALSFFGSRLRLMLRLMKVMLGFGVSGHAA